MNGLAKKRFLRVLLLTLLVAFAAITACVCLSGCGELRYDHYVLTLAENGDGTYTVTACTVVKDQPVVIPHEKDGKVITKLGDGSKAVFGGCEFTTLKIAAGVEEIADNACLNWTPLTTVELGDGLKRIGANAFSGCINLRTDINEAVPASVDSIGEGAFENTAWYKAQPNGQIIYVGSFLYEFKGNMPDGKSYTAADFKASTKYIADYAFSGCIGLQSIEFPASVEKIGSYAFAGCTNIRSIVIPETVKSMGEHVFDGCSHLGADGEIVIPQSIGVVPASMFYDCSGLTEVKVLSGITSVGASAFENCMGLTTITLPETVTTIEENAFANCIQLKTVTAPKVKDIGDKAFYNDIALYNYQLSDDIETIGVESFYNCVKIDEIVFPATLKTVGESAFNNCVNLKKVVVGYKKNQAGLSFGEEAFDNCFALERVESAGIADWCDIAFLSETSNPLWKIGKLYIGDDKVAELILTEEVTEVGAYAFVNTEITKVTVSKKLTAVGASAFKNCIKLAEGGVYAEDMASWCGIKFADPESNPLYYGEKLYEKGKLVEELTVPGSVSVLSDYAFYNDIALKKVVIGGNVSYVGSKVFSGCSHLAKVDITGYGEQPEDWAGDWNDFIGAEVKSDEPIIVFSGKTPFKWTTNIIMAVVAFG